jgi:hypothetical protein
VKVVLHHPDQPRDYRIISVIELKRKNNNQIAGETQMVEYMERINEISAPPDSFKGFLVLQDTVKVFSYYTDFFGIRLPMEVGIYSMFDAANPWTRDLADIAIQYWN